jgi:hypothetical protein
MTEQSTPPWSEEFLEKLNSVKNKRARAVIQHILTYGSVSTEELKDIYGYNHPPRAAKDVRDEGIPLVTYRIKGANGRSIAAYRFGDPTAGVTGREGGRRQFSKRFKRQLYEECEGKCAIIWQDEEASLHDDLQQAARANAVSLQEYIKQLLKNLLLLTILLLTIVVGLLGVLFLFVRTAASGSRKK